MLNMRSKEQEADETKNFASWYIFSFPYIEPQSSPHILGKIDPLKGVLHPRPVFGLFLHFSRKLQHIGNKKDMFLIGNISGNLITALEFH